MEDRLTYIEKKLASRRVYYSAYNPRSSYLYDVEDADEDIRWLVSEVERLRAELQAKG
jgi:uncharacterized small protein (DUF1192 family)